MMMIVRGFAQLRNIEDLRVFVKVKHRIVFAVFAVICDVFAEPHILHIKRDQTAVTALNALAELL